MLTFTQLREQLGLSQPALTKLIRDGLPYSLEGRTKVFDDQAVARWLVETKRAVVEGQEDASKIARTRRECAEHFGVHLRTVADWLEDATFPGRSGNRGLRDGYFPLEEIAEWMATRGACRNGGPQNDGSELRDQLLAVKIRRESLRTDRDELGLKEELGRLTSIESVVEVVTRQIHTAKTLLEALPDEAARSLPDSLDAQVRAAIIRRWRERVFEAERVLSEAAACDVDQDESET